MSSVNKVILIGRVGKDPEIRRMTSGDMVVSFSLATSERWRDKQSGEKKEKTDWHDIVIFNEGLAKVAESYVRKGSQIYIEGQLQTREWEQDGQKRRRTEVVLQKYRGELTLLDGKRDDVDGASANSDKSSAKSYAQAKSAPSASKALDDDIPF